MAESVFFHHRGVWGTTVVALSDQMCHNGQMLVLDAVLELLEFRETNSGQLKKIQIMIFNIYLTIINVKEESSRIYVIILCCNVTV